MNRRLALRTFLGLFILVSCIASSLSRETVCKAVTDGTYSIQGVVINPDKTGYLFVNDRVFDFHAGVDLRQDGSSHSLNIKSEGISVEKRFPGLYLTSGNQIYNVYGLFNNLTSAIYFVVSNEALEKGETDGAQGFYYDLNERASFEMAQATVPKHFPFVYFSDNVDRVYLYQIPVYTFQARYSIDDRDTSSYFVFNAMDRKMEFKKVDGLSTAKSEIDKLFTSMVGKFLLHSGFVFQDTIYLITAQDVYMVSEKELRTNAMPKNTRIPLSQFLTCEEAAIMNPIDTGFLIFSGLAFILVCIIIVLLFLIFNGSGGQPKLLGKPRKFPSSGGAKTTKSGSQTSKKASAESVSSKA